METTYVVEVSARLLGKLLAYEQDGYVMQTSKVHTAHSLISVDKQPARLPLTPGLVPRHESLGMRLPHPRPPP